ncbi:MAG: endonuclease/exonuclease/phosphatase family protein [Bacteroidota bacterium]
MRIATFNVENLFNRPKPFNTEYDTAGRQILKDYYELNNLLREPEYTDSIKTEIETFVQQYKLIDRTIQERDLVLRDIRKKLWIQHKDGTKTWQVNGYAEFLGWVELEKDPVDADAIQNTARVLAEVNADIQLLIEIEDRTTLQKFHDNILKPMLEDEGKEPYKHILLLDGNDGRGIDIGLLSRVPVEWIRSHIEVLNNAKHPMFPRDCIQFVFALKNGEKLVLFGNHFSSQASDKTGKRRKEQSELVSEYVKATLATYQNVVVAGDFNENPSKGSMTKLLTKSKLKDAMLMEQYKDKDIFPGTFKTGSATNKLDYLLLSESLQNKVLEINVNRKGYKSRKWEPYPTVKEEWTYASDHHCVWVELDIE